MFLCGVCCGSIVLDASLQYSLDFLFALPAKYLHAPEAYSFNTFSISMGSFITGRFFLYFVEFHSHRQQGVCPPLRCEHLRVLYWENSACILLNSTRTDSKAFARPWGVSTCVFYTGKILLVFCWISHFDRSCQKLWQRSICEMFYHSPITILVAPLNLSIFSFWFLPTKTWAGAGFC